MIYEISVQLSGGRERGFRVRGRSAEQALERFDEARPELLRFGRSMRERAGLRALDPRQLIEVDAGELSNFVRLERRFRAKADVDLRDGKRR